MNRIEYRRTFDPSGTDSLAKLARWIRPGTAVLELGSAGGYFTEFLASRAAAVDIVEIDERAAAQASAYARRTVVADLDGDRWLEALGPSRYDTIVCADVLEHLRDGARLVQRLRALLVPGGELVLSVPNVAHNAVIAGLCDDRFDYGGEGLLDPTHVRLYTWRSLARLLQDAGFRIAEWDATTLSAFDTEFRVRNESLPPALREVLDRRPRGQVYQWLVRAAPDAQRDLGEPPAVDAHDTVTVRLLHAPAPEALSLERAIVSRVPLGGPPAELEWKLPEPPGALRLMLADRIGVVRIDEVVVKSGHETLWSLSHGAAYRAQGVVRIDATTFALVAPDAWIEPVVSPDALLRADRVAATMGWPSTIAEVDEFAAFAALARASAASEAQAEESRHRMLQAEDAARLEARRLANEAASHETTRAALENVQAALSRRNAHVDHLEQAVESYRAENARLDAAVTAQERIIGYRQSLRWWLRLPFVRVKLWWHRLTTS